MVERPRGPLGLGKAHTTAKPNTESQNGLSANSYSPPDSTKQCKSALSLALKAPCRNTSCLRQHAGAHSSPVSAEPPLPAANQEAAAGRHRQAELERNASPGAADSGTPCPTAPMRCCSAGPAPAPPRSSGPAVTGRWAGPAARRVDAARSHWLCSAERRPWLAAAAAARGARAVAAGGGGPEVTRHGGAAWPRRWCAGDRWAGGAGTGG